MHEVSDMSVITKIVVHYLQSLLVDKTVKLKEGKGAVSPPKKVEPVTVSLLVTTKGAREQQQEIVFTVENGEVIFSKLPEGLKMIALSIRLHYRKGHVEDTLEVRMTELYGKGFSFKCN